MTDHKPLQWLSAEKMEGLLCRWALALQEYDFKIVYRPGSQNMNADALSRRELVTSSCALTFAVRDIPLDELHSAQQNDPLLMEIHKPLNLGCLPSTLLTSSLSPTMVTTQDR